MLSGSSHSTKPALSAGMKVSPASSATPAANQTSRRVTERPEVMTMRSGAGALVLGEQEQLGFQPEGIGRRLSLFPGRALAAHQGDELAFLVLETNDLESERDDGAQVGVAERLADEPVDLALVDRAHRQLPVGVAGQHDPQHARMAHADELDQIEAGQAGHDLIGDDELDRLHLEELQRLLAAVG